MHDQTVRGTSPQPFACGARLVAPAVALALMLAGCLLDTSPQPATPTPIPPTPTLLPTPTAQARVILPTAEPTSAPGPTPTATPTPIRELGGAGQLLYQGWLNGRRGLILVDADGGGRRLIAAGNYLFGQWSPDGQRIAATANDDLQPAANRLDLLAADGRLLRRFPFEGNIASWYWSPDSRRVAIGVTEQPSQSARRGRTTTWLLDEGGATEVTLGSYAYPLPWSPDGRLLLVVSEDSDGDERITDADRRGLWTADAGGRNPRQLLAGAYGFAGWSPDGATLYLLDFTSVEDRPGEAPDHRETALLALDVRTGERRTLATVAMLAARLGGADAPAVRHAFGGVALAPTGDRVAVWLAASRRSGAASQALPSALFVMDVAGCVTWQEGGVADTRPDLYDEVSWSPDGARLAYGYYTGNGIRGLRVLAFDARGGLRDQFAIEGTNAAGPRWSPDGRWVAFTQAEWLMVASGEPPARSWSVRGADMGSQRLLGWRPAR